MFCECVPHVCMCAVNAFIAPMTQVVSQVPSPDPPPGEYWTRYQERPRGSGHFDQRLNKANTARTIHDNPKSW